MNPIAMEKLEMLPKTEKITKKKKIIYIYTHTHPVCNGQQVECQLSNQVMKNNFQDIDLS